MLPGVIVKPLKVYCDERGFFSEIMRSDWKEILKDEINQANFSITYPGMIRAWHRHEKDQVDYFVVLKGALKLCAFDEESGELDEIVSTNENRQIVRIPGHYWHGFKAIGDLATSLLYFTTKLYDSKNPDEERRPWNDATIVPLIINDNKKDPRVGKPWDWNYPPYK